MAFNTIQARQEREKLITEYRRVHDGTVERGLETAEEREQLERLKTDISKWDVKIRDEEWLQQQEADAAKSLMESRNGDSNPGKQWDGIHHQIPGISTPTPAEWNRGISYVFHAWLRCAKPNPVIEEEHKRWAQKLGIDFRQRQIDIPLIKNYRDFAKYYEQRDLNIVTSTKGVETIPEGFVYNLEVAMKAYGGMREVSDVFRTDGFGDVPWPTVNDRSNVGELLGEASDFGTSVDPVFGSVIFKAFKYSSKVVKISSELLQDSPFDLAARLGEMLGIRLAAIQNQHFTSGAGTILPKGITVASVQGVLAGGATIEADDIINLEHSVDPLYRRNARFMMHDKILAKVRLLKESTTNAFIWQAGLQLGVPDRLVSYPYTINQDMEDTEQGNAALILFGEFNKYKIRDVATLRLIRLDELYAATDQVGFVAYMRSDGNLVDAGTNPVKFLELAGS